MKCLFTLYLLLSALLIFAQPANDNCSDALPVVQLDGTCITYDFNTPTFDLTNGSCASPTVPNVWFTFLAVGSTATISILNNVDVNITIVSLPNGCGDFTGTSEIGCGDSLLSINNLVIGETYYLIVADAGTTANSFEMCIFNPQTPPNDDPCGATPVAPGGCTNGTTLGADVNFIIPGCPAANYENAVFFSYQLGPLTNQLDVEIATNGITGEMGALLLEFPAGCAGGATLAGANTTYCGPPTNSLSFENLSPGSLVYLMIGSSTSGAGDFSGVCFTEIEGDLPCDNNIDCASASVINIPVTGTPFCVTGCNVGMPLVDLNQCGGTIAPTSWFSFNTGTNNTAVFNITSTELANPIIILVTNCNQIVECNPVNFTLLQNTTYQILISDALAATGTFELCVTLLNINSPCIKDETFSVTGTSLDSPLEGPYQPGEIITFTYTTNFLSTGNCQWIHSFIPYFSDCWNNVVPQVINPPEGTSVPTTFNWYPAGSTHWKPITDNPSSVMGIDINGKICLLGTPNCTPFAGGGDCNSTGTSMPAGWVVTTPAGSCGGSTLPNESWGIPQECSTNVHYTLKFNVQIPQGAFNCNDSEGFTVGLAVFPDGATGGWANPQCNGNSFLKITLPVNTCEYPIMAEDSADMEICSGDTFDTYFNLVPYNSTIEWTVTSNTAIIGEQKGSGIQISQKLENTSTIPQMVRYFIYPLTLDSCYGELKILTVKVLPGIRNNIPNMILCNDSIVNLKSIPNGGTGGNYGFIWSSGEVDMDSISFKALTDTFLILTITDSIGCSTVDTIYIDVIKVDPVAQPSDTSLIGNTVFPYNSSQVFSVNPFLNADEYVWTLDGIEIGQGISVKQYFPKSSAGNHTLCVTAFNVCKDDPNTLCWNIIALPEPSTADCIGADTICSKELQEFSFAGNAGDLQEWGTDPGCDFMISEFNSHWLTFSIAKAGQLWFTIYPSILTTDIDFILYKSSAGCEQKEAIRCSLSSCNGNTGLLPTEVDEIEDANCNDGQNNFLKALDCEVGERYYLSINDFSTVENKFKIDFCGNAFMTCDTVFCETSSRHEMSLVGQYKVYPNPNQGNFTLELPLNQKVVIEIYDIQGIRVYQQVSDPGNSLQQIELKNYQPSVYNLIVRNSEGLITGISRLAIIKN